MRRPSRLQVASTLCILGVVSILVGSALLGLAQLLVALGSVTLVLALTLDVSP